MCHSSKSLMDEWKTDDMFAETLYLYSNFWKNNKNNNFQTLKHGEFAFMRSADSEVHSLLKKWLFLWCVYVLIIMCQKFGTIESGTDDVATD